MTGTPNHHASRRVFLVGVGTFILTGCAQSRSSNALPSPAWDARSPDLDLDDGYPAPSRTPTRTALDVLPRSSWSRGAPNTALMTRMSPIRYITVHHTAIEFTSSDQRSTAAHIESVRRFHRQDRGWGDIGYHFIVDRAGRVWEGRPLAWQGAHVRDHNPSNIGVVCLGNFETQRPTDAQTAALTRHVRALQSRFRVSRERLKTHKEWAPTACPGRSLQTYMVSARSSGRFG